MKFRVGDNVIVIAGADRGKKGLITKVLEKTDRVVVEGANKRIRHTKGRDGNPGERVEFFAPLHVSNIAIQDPKTQKPTRLRYKVEGKDKTRIAKSSGEIIPAPQKSKSVK